MDFVSKAKSANHTNKLRVFGYIIRNRHSLNLQTIPPLIMCITLAYYHIPEFFAKFRKDCFEVSPKKYTITNIGEGLYQRRYAIFLCQNIHSLSSKVYKWTFKVTFASSMVLGLLTTPQKDQNIHRPFHLQIPSAGYYTLTSQGWLWRFPASSLFNKHKSLPKNILLSGDIITFILDLSRQIISCYINHEGIWRRYILYKNIDIGANVYYNMTLEIPNRGDSVTMLQFLESEP